MGGDLHHPLLAAFATVLPSRSTSLLRFDFRGGGRSEGTHGGGVDEANDLAAALDAVADREAPTLVVGYSFGAEDPPIAFDDRPALVVLARHDQFVDADEMTTRASEWTGTEVAVVEGADHFLAGHVDRVVDAVVEFVDRVTGPPA